MEMEEYITKELHNEYAQRVDDENRRQNRRIGELESQLREIRDLTASVRELAVNMRNMLEEQARQGERLEALESRDGEMWRKVTGHLITVVAGIIVGYIFTKIGM